MMNKISRRSFLQAAGVVAAAAALTACGGKTEADKGSSQNGKIQITFYLWDRSMMKELTPWLEQKFPEYEFNFIQSPEGQKEKHEGRNLRAFVVEHSPQHSNPTLPHG